MKSSIKMTSLLSLVTMAQSTELNPDPVGQRPPVTSGIKKSVQIVKSILDGYGCGMITVRDISNDTEAQKIYGKGTKWLVIDGGHRIRALRNFFEGKFPVNNEIYSEMDFNLSDIEIPVDVRVCTSQEATELFRKINTTTPVNFMEMVMSDEESIVCQYIRSQTMNVKEYDNEPHPLFEYYRNQRSGSWVVKNFDSDPNPRRKWDEYVAIALIRAISGGIVDCGQPEIEKVAANCPPITENSKKVVEKFLYDTLKLRKVKGGGGLNQSQIAAFIVYWFGLYGENKNFAIKDDAFYQDFLTTYSMLMGKYNKALVDETVVYDGVTWFTTDFFSKNIKNFSNGKVQNQVYSLLRQYCKGDGLVLRDDKRSINGNHAAELLAQQGFVCALDGKPLELKDAVFGHDKAWSDGGETSIENGAMIRESWNREMGTLSFDDFRAVLKARGVI